MALEIFVPNTEAGEVLCFKTSEKLNGNPCKFGNTRIIESHSKKVKSVFDPTDQYAFQLI